MVLWSHAINQLSEEMFDMTEVHVLEIFGIQSWKYFYFFFKERRIEQETILDRHVCKRWKTFFASIHAFQTPCKNCTSLEAFGISML